MKFDFLLIFMIIAILLNQDFKNVILTGIMAGLLSAMTTTFPGGQIPNMVDKIVTCLVVFLLLKSFKHFKINYLIVGFIGGFGTMVSGLTFLTTALFITGLPVPISVLIIGIVIPTTIVNTVGTVFIYKIVKTAVRRNGVAI